MMLLAGFVLPLPWLRRAAPWAGCCVILCFLAACGGHRAYRSAAHYPRPAHHYPPPGPPSDPWGPYVREAAGRFNIPDTWIRQVMRQESGGRDLAISSAGAMGLMQIMPDTYAELQARYRLVNDPYEPRSNIMAGAAYIREMYERFGSPGFLAAYNAGPNRLNDYLDGSRPLPSETVNYVASVAPRLGGSASMSGPLAVYAQPVGTYVAQTTSSGCDPDAAYDPTRPCTSYAQPAAAPVATQPAPSLAAASDCDPDLAYDPTRPCLPVQVAALPAASEPPPAPPVRQSFLGSRSAATQVSASGGIGAWAVQVGAFSNSVTARLATENAQRLAPEQLAAARRIIAPTAPFGTTVLYRARLAGLSPDAASGACARLSGAGISCMVVRPEDDRSF